MREILFRGRTIEGKEWVNGYMAVYSSAPFIGAPNSLGTMLWFGVNPDTLGQYTGLTDKDGVKIFEGDIVRVAGEGTYCCRWDEGNLEYELVNERESFGLVYADCDIKVIGNIHDNPETLGG